MRRKPIYLDYAATTPLDPRAGARMLPYFGEAFGNPSSVHSWGQQAEAVLEQARVQIASYLGCDSDELIFTSGGSESDNLALRGAAFAARQTRAANHILVSPVEHPAVLETARQLQELHGFELEFLPVDGYGRVEPSGLADRLRSDTAVVSVLHGNNEIGTINPIAELGALCRQRGVPFHTDALQSVAQLELQVDRLEVDLLSIGAHKFYGPKGVGALYVRGSTPLLPVQTGGSHERGQRAGTSNVPLIAGMAEALAVVAERRETDAEQFAKLRDRIVDTVLGDLPDVQLTGHPTDRLPNHASFVFAGVDANRLLAALDLAGYACSSASACKTGEPEPSEVLLAIGLEPRLAMSSLRVTVGRQTTFEEVEAFLNDLPEAVSRMRAVEPAFT
ncbi:MAG: cysteine desulfurase family protein [Anaerolineales bacterium]